MRRQRAYGFVHAKHASKFDTTKGNKTGTGTLPALKMGAIQLPRGQVLVIFDPLPPLTWTILLNKAYEVTWTFDYPPPLFLSTWLLNDPHL